MGEFFNKLKSGFGEFWNGLEKGQRTRIIIAGALSILILVSFVIYASNPQYDILYSDLSKTDAGEINAKLKEMGIKAKMEGTTIKVPKDHVDEIRAQLAVEGLPKEDTASYPEMTQPSFYETSEDKKQRYLMDKQKQLTIGIKAIKGVDWANVNLYIPDDSSYVLSADDSKQESTAAIMIKMKPGMPALDQNQVNGIVQYVSKSVKDLKSENVSIIDDMGRSLVKEQGDLSDQVNTQMDMQEEIKNKVEKSVTKFLETVFGPNNVDVRAAVKLNFNNEQQESTEFTPIDQEKNSGIVRNMQDIKKEWVDAANSGIPGTDTNTTTTDVNQYVEGDLSNAKYSEASTVVNYEINETKKQIVKEQGNVDSLSISVIINQNSLKQDMLADINGLTGNVKELVKYATQGFNIQQAAADNNINVKVMQFSTAIKDQIDQAKAEEQKQKNNELMVQAGTGAAAVLVFAAAMFFFLRGRVRSKREDELEMEGASPIYMPPGPPVAEIDTEDRNEVKKKIEKFVGQRPEQVAQLLKTWITEE